MASKLPDEPCNSETEAETIAMRIKRKRSRRVSFADTEITSVHIFNRDEDSDNPPDSEPQSSSQNDSAEQEKGVVGFFKDLGGESDDFKDSDDEDDGRKSFLRPLGSPSPGSSIPGSATSNDEDNFFGPVSTDFIRPGLSDSAASDNFHETTLDTTAFSLHYRSLARSDSGGDLKTPTAFRLAFEEKTPTHNPSDSGSLMSLTKPKNRTPQSLVHVDKVRGGEDSNDMSIIEENPHRYDYGRLSPTLDALLAEGSKDLHADSVPAPIITTSSKVGEVAALAENGIGHVDQINGRSTKMGYFDTHDISTDPASVSRIKLSEANGALAFDVSSNRSYHPSAGDSIDDQIQTPNQLIKDEHIVLEVDEIFLVRCEGFCFMNQSSEGKNKNQEPEYVGYRPDCRSSNFTFSVPLTTMMVSNELTEDAFKKGMESLELPAVNGDVLANINSKAAKALQFDVFLLPDPASQHLNQGLGKENSPKDRRYNSNIDHHSDKEGSIFLLSNKGQQSILNTPNLARQSGTVTPSSKHNEWYPSIQKSISRLRIPEPSPRASSLKEGIEKLKCRLSSYSSPNAPLSTVLADISKDLQFAFNNSPTAFMEKQLAIGDLEKKVLESLVNIDSNGNENPVNISMLGKDEKSTDPAKDEESLHHMFTDTLSKDKLDKPIEEVASPSQLSAPGSKLTQHLLMSENPTKGTLVSSGTHSLLADEPEANFPHVQIQSENNFQTPLSSAGILKFQSRSPAKYFQAGVEPQSKPYVCRSKTEPSLQSPSYKVSASNPSMEGPSQSPPRAKQTPSPPLRNTPRSPLRIESTRSPSRKKLAQSPGKEPIRSPIVKEVIQSLFLKEPTQSPFRSSYAEHTDNMRPVGKDMVSSEFNSNRHPNDDCYQGLHMSQSPLTEQDAENSFGRKRRNLGIALEDGDCTDKIHSSQRSSKVHRSENYNPQFMLGHSSTLHSDREKFGGESVDTKWKSWTDIVVKFSGDSEQLLSPLTSNLNLKGIGVLEDILMQLLKAKKYETLCAEIQSQKINCISAGHNRVAEARLLLYRVVYEKAKLHLMHLKREKLQSRVQLLSSAVQESQVLKLNFIQCRSETGKRKTLVDESHRQSCLVNPAGEQEASCDIVNSMRQELKASDGEIKSLSKFFHSRIKLKGEPSCADTISLVHDHLKTRTCCRLIRQDLQLWDVDEFEIKNGHYNILLSYHGYISQRFTGNVGTTSHTVISKKLNDVKITKAFSNMDAQVAFAFVLDGEATKEIVDSRCLAQETQVTRSQLCNLLDVVEEVQLARFEIVNLIQTSFHTPSADQLDLQLCFLNFKSSRKVTLSLDMTCLNRGIYPSEILPYQIRVSESAAQVLLPESLLAELRAAAEGLESGYTRIMRLCKCISQVV